MIVFYWLVTITGLLAAKQIKKLGRRYAFTVSKEFIIYKEPFTSKSYTSGKAGGLKHVNRSKRIDKP